MDDLIKQTRERFSNVGKENKEQSSSTARDRKISPQKTLSFREKRRSEGWIKRLFSRQTNVDGGEDFPAAIAATALAIQSLEESRTRDQEKTTHGPDTSLAKTKSKAEDKVPVKFSDETSKTSAKDTNINEAGPTPSIKKKPTFSSTDPNNIIIEKKPEKALPEKAAEKQPTSADKSLNIAGSETPETTVQYPVRPPTTKSTTRPVETTTQIPTKPGPGDTKADAWEKAEMARTKERYEKLSNTIQNWETKKKNKAKRKLESIEAQLDKERAKAIQKYHSNMIRIEDIAQGATKQAQKNRTNEEIKIREKADKFRSTGKPPATCLCF